jgi:hypothetical protein
MYDFIKWRSKHQHLVFMRRIFTNLFLGFLFLSMIHLPEIFYNLSGEPYVFKDYCDILKDIFICLMFWEPILNKYTNVIYE